MLREDKKAYITVGRVFFMKRYGFRGTGAYFPYKTGWKADRYAEMERQQRQRPVPLVRDGPYRWLWFEGRFYKTDEDLSSQDILALLRERERRQRRQLERAYDNLRLDQQPRSTRQPIPREVRRAVFERDGGRCVQCGSNFDLQYDHILPVARGGATSVPNLQLLCADCNREKSDSL